MDALYAQTPVLELVRKNGWDAVLSLKQNSRDLYQSAVRLFAARPPDADFTEQRDHKTYRVQLWDTEGLPFTIRSEEHTSELQSQSNLVCRLLLEKKKKRNTRTTKEL